MHFGQVGGLLPLGAQILKHITVLLYFTYRLYFWFFSEYGLVASKLLLFLSFLAILKFENLKFIVNVIKKEVRKKGPRKKKRGQKKKKKKRNGCRGGGAHYKKKKKKNHQTMCREQGP